MTPIAEGKEYEMQRLRFPIAVALTSLGLVAPAGRGGGAAGGQRAGARPMGRRRLRAVGGGRRGRGRTAAEAPGAAAGGLWGGGALPAQLAGLRDVPAAERFDHFKGVQVNLTDKDGQPLVSR